MVTLTSISATYSGGDVAVGTALTDLTGIVVTAHYSDGTTAEVTGYTLSGEIAEGSNIITVKYGVKTTTFTVTGVAEVVYGIHQVDCYSGGLNTNISQNTPVDKIILTVDVKANCSKGSSFIIAGPSQNLAWTADGVWDTCTADLQPSEFVGLGKKTITIIPTWSMSQAGAVWLKAFAGMAPEMVWYEVKMYSGETLLASMKPTETLGKMYDEVRDTTLSFSTTDGLTLVEG